MHAMLLGIASLTLMILPATPALADGSEPGFTGRPSSVHGDFGRGDRDGRRNRRGGEIVVSTWVEGGEWARHNNRSFEPDSFNGWWHDRPDRAYPRWMNNNQNCQRQWWSGGGWRC